MKALLCKLGLLYLTLTLFTGCHTAKREEVVFDLTISGFEPSSLGWVDFPGNSVHINEEYNSEVSICLENESGMKKLLIFSAPVLFQDGQGLWQPIDTRLRSVTDAQKLSEGYIYQTANSDITAYYPLRLEKEKGICIERLDALEYGIPTDRSFFSHYVQTANFSGETQAGVRYEEPFGPETELVVYPTSLGARNEVVLKSGDFNDIRLWLRADGYRLKAEPGGYLLLLNDEKDKDGNEQIAGIIHSPLMKDQRGEISINSRLEFESQDSMETMLRVIPDTEFLSNKDVQYPVFLSFDIEWRREKQPDTQVFSGKPNLNAYLRNYTLIGNHPEYGDSQCYIRYQFFDIFGLDPESIQSAELVTSQLTKTPLSATLHSVSTDWCSLTSNWKKKAPYKPMAISQQKTAWGEVRFDVTEIVKKYVQDKSGELQRNGLLLKSEEENFAILTSADSSLYPMRTEIILK